MKLNGNKKLSLLALGLGVAALVASTRARAAVTPGEFVVRLAKNGSQADLAARVARMNMTLGEELLTDDEGTLFVVRASGTQIMSADFQANALNRLSNTAGVEFAEPNYRYSIVGQGAQEVPNVGRFGELWGMHNVGQKDAKDQEGRADADIDAPEAWDLTTGGKNVTVAVVDTGVEYDHPNLKDNMWSMPGKPNVHGFNAISSSKKDDPRDDNGHGTHCAGTVGGVGDQGVFGVNHVANIMAIKILSASGGGSLDGIVKGLKFAADNGARVISASWGGEGESQALFDAVKYARSKGVLFVAAAGNGDKAGKGQNNDKIHISPASYSTKLDNIVAVAASDNRDEMAVFSNFGPLSVHLMAPGARVLSSVLKGAYAAFSGTSMATPHVAGAATLLLSKEPGLSYLQVKDRLLSSVDKVPAAQGKTVTGGRLNVARLIGAQ